MSNNKRTFTTEFLREEILWGPSPSKILVNDIIDTRRWSTDYYLVFEFEGKCWETSYSRGSTECQDEQPFEDYGDEVECTQVEPIQVLTTQYIAVTSDV